MSSNRDKIRITDLEVFYHVGVPDEERVQAQRLLLSLELEHDFTRAASADDLGDTIDYHALSRRLTEFGAGRHWRLIETLASDLAAMVLEEFKPSRVAVEVKKFVIPNAASVSVWVQRER